MRVVDGRWHLETAAGTQDEVDVVIAATGVLHHPAVPRHRGPRRPSRARCFHSARWDHDVPLDGPRVGVDRHRLDRRADHARPSSTGSRAELFQRTAQWIMPQENPAYTDEEQADVPDDPDTPGRDARQRSAMFGGLRQRRGRRRLAEHADDRGGRAWPTSSRTSATPCCASGCAPTTARRASGSIVSADFYEAIQEPERRARHRPDRADRAGGRAHRRRPLHELDVLVLATGFQADAFMRPMARDRAGRPHAGRGVGRRARTRTCRSRSPSSRTSSCSTAPTARSATSRSSRSPSCRSAYILQLVERSCAARRREISAPAQTATGRVRASPREEAPEDDLGHGLSELVPRRPGRAGDVAVAVRPLPGRDGRPRPSAYDRV